MEQFVGSLDRVTTLLKKHNLEFALIEGLASSIRGRVRVTAGDLVNAVTQLHEESEKN